MILQRSEFRDIYVSLTRNTKQTSAACLIEWSRRVIWKHCLRLLHGCVCVCVCEDQHSCWRSSGGVWTADRVCLRSDSVTVWEKTAPKWLFSLCLFGQVVLAGWWDGFIYPECVNLVGFIQFWWDFTDKFPRKWRYWLDEVVVKALVMLNYTHTHLH